MHDFSRTQLVNVEASYQNPIAGYWPEASFLPRKLKNGETGTMHRTSKELRTPGKCLNGNNPTAMCSEGKWLPLSGHMPTGN